MGETNVTDGLAAPGSSRPDENRQARTPRAARTREAVVDALLALLDEGNMRPTAREVADKANVSLRSVYVHFDDVEALFLAAAARHRARVLEACGELVVTGSFEERLEAFIERRHRALEVAPNVRRAGYLQEPFSPAIHEALTGVRELLRAAIDQVFAPELESADPEDRKFLRSAVMVAVSSAAWDDMRLRQGLPVDETMAVMSGLVRLIFQNAAPSGSNDEAGR